MKKLFLAFLISLIPFSSFRRILYSSIMRYRIPSTSTIGFLTVINVRTFELGDKVRIGPLNLFKGPMDVKIGAFSRIGKLNRFTCASHIRQERFKHMGYTPILDVGLKALILDQHFFDIYGKVVIGDSTWIAGHGSEFWTHGLSAMDRDIIIGEKNYIGSASLFAPGTSIGSNNIVALGSVVMSKHKCNSSLISGNPAKPFRSIEQDLVDGKYKFSFDDWAD